MPDGVRILIIDESERVLVSIRASDAKYYPETIQVPGGGVDEGEDPRDAAVREVFEETGLVLERDSLVHLASLLGTRTGEDIQYTRHSFLYRWAGEMLVEHTEPEKSTPWVMVPVNTLTRKGTLAPGLLPGLIDALNVYKANHVH